MFPTFSAFEKCEIACRFGGNGLDLLSPDAKVVPRYASPNEVQRVFAHTCDKAIPQALSGVRIFPYAEFVQLFRQTTAVNCVRGMHASNRFLCFIPPPGFEEVSIAL